MAKALVFYQQSTGVQDTKSTEQFVRFMDCFFDCFNVRSLDEGKKTRNAQRDPYRSPTDWRFNVRAESYRCMNNINYFKISICISIIVAQRNISSVSTRLRR